MPFYPAPHNYWSKSWVSDELDPPPPLGEVVDAVRTYFKGGPVLLPPAGQLLGRADCVEGGDLFPVLIPGRTLVNGFDSRCPQPPPMEFPPANGGLPAK